MMFLKKVILILKKNILPTYIRIDRNDWALLKKLCNKKVSWKNFVRKFWQ